MHRLIIIAILLAGTISFAQELKVGIMRSYEMSSVKISYNENDFQLRSDSTGITKLSKDQSIYFRRSGDKVKVEKNGQSLGSFDTVYVTETVPNSSFSIQSIVPSSKKIKKYQNDLAIFPSGTSQITVVNLVKMENYLAGVIESEGGGGKHIEYYKVQAILSRTYVLDHMYKHKKEGFQVCDGVHCQAYHSMLRFTPTILQAVEETKGIIMLDHHLELADGYFFANCGGQTSESDFVWNVAVPYCRSIVDTFCIQSKQATWKHSIPKSTWRDYMVKQFGFPVNDSLFGDYLYHFSQPIRGAFFLDPRLGIPLRDLRTHFKLKSTWFDCYLDGGNVILEGKGFGHGVGLCQEGAMGMAKQGYSYRQILHFYFTDVQLFNYYHWLFLKQEEGGGL